ncbi:MAG: FG-GAP repeat domain-containing protein [Candidatus Binatia bacterium]
MKVWAKSAIFLVIAGSVAVGCQWGHPAPKPLALEKPPAPMRYIPARQGLPTTKIWKSQIAFGDINGDGFPDVGAVSRLADGPWIWKGNGKGQWTDASRGLPRETFCGGGMAFGDANNDGKMDVAIADHCRGVFVYFGDGKGHWKNASAGLPTVGSEDVDVGDFNHDGCLDLALVASSEAGVRAFKGNCKGVWRESSKGLAQKEWGNAVVVADVDADGNLDIVAAYSAGPRVWLGDGKGSWKAASEGMPAPDIHGLYWGIDVGDVNGDGKLDVASGAAVPGAEVFIQEPGPKWRKTSKGIIPMNALGVALGDLNNDGHVDLVVAGKSNLEEIGGVYGVFPFLGDGAGNWTLVDNTGLPTTGRERTWGANLADIDGDGVLDIGVAFGDVLSPSWRSGPTRRSILQQQGKKKGEHDKTVAKPKKRRPPVRGMFGAIEIWRGELTGK